MTTVDSDETLEPEDPLEGLRGLRDESRFFAEAYREAYEVLECIEDDDRRVDVAYEAWRCAMVSLGAIPASELDGEDDGDTGVPA